MGTVLALSSALGGAAFVALITEWFRRHRTGAETDELSAKAVDIITKTSIDLVERSTKLADQREAKLEGKISILESKVDHLSQVIDGLVQQLEANGIDPIILPRPNNPIQ